MLWLTAHQKLQHVFVSSMLSCCVDLLADMNTNVEQEEFSIHCFLELVYYYGQTLKFVFGDF